MPLIAANDIAVVEADFVLPVSRAWHVDLTADTSDPSTLTGAVTINVNEGALTFSGTARSVDVFNNTVRARIVAGAGGLAVTAKPKAYRQTTAKIVLQDLLATAGEKLSATADPSVLARQLAAWCVVAMPVADAVGLLMSNLGASWRMLPDGTLWCGNETWPDSGLDYALEHDDKAHSQVVITSEAPVLLPGQSLDGRNISYVEHHVDHKSVRTMAWVATSASYDRLRDSMVAMTRSSLPAIDYRALYRCQVVAQSSDMTTLDLKPEDARLPAAGFSEVPLRHGLPGCKVQVSTGTYVLLGWINGDPSKPFCGLWQGGESVQSLQLGGNTPVARKGDTVDIGSFQCNGAGASFTGLTWTPPGGGSPVVITTSPVDLTGKVSSGSSIVGAG